MTFFAENLNVYWKISMEGKNDKLAIYKDVSIWLPVSYEGMSTAVRFAHERFDLPYEIMKVSSRGMTHSINDNDNVIKITDNGVTLKNCYIKVHDPGLREQIKEITTMTPFRKFQPAMLQSAQNEGVEDFFNKIEDSGIVDINEIKEEILKLDNGTDYKDNLLEVWGLFEHVVEKIPASIFNHIPIIDLRIQASCKPNNENGQYPILYYPMETQPEPQSMALARVKFIHPSRKKYLGLRLENRGLGQAITWDVGDESHTTKSIFPGDYPRTVLVHSEGSTNEYKFYTDIIPMGSLSMDQIPDSAFSHSKGEFYIGHKPGTDEVFNGTIERIVFDPNSSCTGCDPLV